MIEFLQANFGEILTFLGGGGLISWATRKYTKKSAEANAMKEWQDVYQETIKDLRSDKDILKEEITDLRLIVNKNTLDIEELKSYECIVVDCALRKRKPRTKIFPNEKSQ